MTLIRESIDAIIITKTFAITRNVIATVGADKSDMTDYEQL